MRAGAVAAAAGVNLETLRYYEGRGLLPTPDRSLGGHRIYGPETVTTLRVIRAAQRLGFTLDEISDLLTVGRHHHGTGRRPAGLQALARDKLVEVNARIADLVTIRERLVAAMDAGCDDLTECAGIDGCPIPFDNLAASASS